MKISFFVLIVIGLLLAFVVPLGKIEEQKITVPSLAWAGGELRMTFSPTFHLDVKRQWPPTNIAGSPFDTGLMWVSSREMPGVTFRVTALRLIGQDGWSETLQPQSKTASVQNTDGKYYTVLLYKSVEVSEKITGAIADCTLETPDGKSINGTFNFEVHSVSEQRWVNRIFEQFKGM